MTGKHLANRLHRAGRVVAAAMCALLAACGPSSESGESKSAGKGLKIAIAYFAPDPAAELCTSGLLDGLAKAGFIKGRNLEVQTAHAGGEIANIPPMLQNFDNGDADLIVTFTTPCLTAACSTVKNKPVVFTYVFDPIAAGAGTSRTDHLPFITGVGSFPPVAKTIDLLQALVPGVKSVGTLYNSSEANSRKVIAVAREMFKERGIGLEEVVITNSSEVFQGAQAMTSRNVQAVWITGDNTALLGFDGIVKAAADAKLPLINNDPEFVERGALAAAGLGWYDSGFSAGGVAGRVLLGESPKNIPFEEVAVEKFVINFDSAKKLGIAIPEKVLADAQVFLNLHAKYGRPAKIALLAANDDAAAAKRREGLVKGLADAGVVLDTNAVIAASNAGGDAAKLAAAVSEALKGSPDVIVAADPQAQEAAASASGGKPVIPIGAAPAGSAGDEGEFEAGRAAALGVARALAGAPR